MLSKKTIEQFVEELASDSPAPGGGSVAALGGSLAAALAVMVGRLTVGREKYKDSWDVMQKVVDEGTDLSSRLLSLMEKDTEAFTAYMAARKLPKDTDTEKSARKKAIDDAALETAKVPLSTMELCLKMVKIATTAAKFGNPNAVSDAGMAVMLAAAAAKGAQFNVLINLPGISDTAFAESCRTRAVTIMAEVEEAAKSVNDAVMQMLEP